MDALQPTASRPPVWKLALLVVSLGLATLFTLGRSGLRSADTPPAAPPRPPALYTEVEPARNPEKLTILVDPQKIVGWISGSTDHAGAEVAIKAGGKTDTVKVEAGNTFTWPYKVARSTRAEFTVSKLRQTATLTPPEKPQASVFFVVDRNVYRPGQLLHFAGFLRQLDEHGEFVPLANKAVEVQLKTERKNTIANRWKLISDEFGRLTGSYKFADADPLDTYHLSIPDYKGTANVSLAEYRKAKVQLRITGERVSPNLELRFQAIDFMDKPVPARKVTFTAKVIRKSAVASSGSLKGEDFAHPGSQRYINPRMEDLTEDEQLLIQVDPAYDPGATLFDPLQSALIATMTGEVNLSGKSAGHYLLAIPQSCQQPGHSVVVEAILTDASGREERKTQTIPLPYLSENLKLTLPRTTFGSNEPIEVKANRTDGQELKGSATLVAMKLSAAPPVIPQFLGGWQFGGFQGFNGGMGGITGIGGGFGGNLGIGGVNPGFGFAGFPMPVQRGRWVSIDPPEPVKRSLVTATVFKGDTATIRLPDPGAYKLVAVSPLPAGTAPAASGLRSEPRRGDRDEDSADCRSCTPRTVEPAQFHGALLHAPGGVVSERPAGNGRRKGIQLLGFLGELSASLAFSPGPRKEV